MLLVYNNIKPVIYEPNSEKQVDFKTGMPPHNKPHVIEQQLLDSLKEISDYKYALDASSIVAITDNKGIIKYANDNFCKISKYTEAELIGQDHRIVNSGHHPHEFMHNLWATISKGEIWKGEIKNKAKDGTYYWVDTTIVPFLNKNKKPYQYVSIRTDITPRKEAEEQIRSLNAELSKRVEEQSLLLIEANREMNRLFDKINEVFFSIDIINNRFLQISSSCEKVYGYSREEFIANTNLWKQVILEDDLPLIAENDTKLSRGEKLLNLYRIKHKNGNIKWLEARVTPELSEDKKLVRIDGVCYDVTERQLARKTIWDANTALKLSEDKFKKLFDTSREGLIIGKPDGTLLEVNDAICNMLGYTRNELLKLNRMDITLRDDTETNAAVETRKNTGTYSGRMKLIHKDGRIVQTEISSSLFSNQIGETFSYVCIRDITDKLKAEEELRNSEKRFRSLIDNTTDIIALTDQTGKIQYISPSFEKVTGYTVNERMGKSPFENIHPDDLEHVTQLFKEVISTSGQTVKAEWRQKFKDGGWRWMEGVAINMMSDPVVNAIVHTFREITQRKEAEQKLEAANRELNKLFNSISEVLYSASRNPYKLIQMSDSCEKLYGYTPADFFNDEYLWKKLIFPEDRYIIDELNEKLEKREKATGRYRIYHKNGSVRWIEASLTPTFDANGKLTRIDGVNRDITEEKEKEERLLLSEKRFRALIEKGNDGIALLDKDWTLTYLSPAVKTVTGYEIDEIIGHSLMELMHPDEIESNVALLNTIFKEPGASVQDRFRLLHKDGTWRWIEASATNQLADPAVNAVVGNYREITDRKKAEEQLAALSMELEKKVEERTAQLQEANKSLQLFSYAVAHDLRSPLRIVSGYARVLANDYGAKLDPDAQNLLNVIVGHSKLMGQLITDLLSLSQVSRAEMTTEPVDMNKLVNEVLSNIKEAETDLTANISIEDLGSCICDASMIKQVWFNIISNAIKYSRKNPAPVIQIGSKLENGTRTFYVSDNGVGFDMQNAGKLFEVFQRLHNKTDFEGNGIGLAISQRIIHKHGGKIWAEAKTDAGATFYFTIPQ
jgi:PAS domain S-box-containing protein